MLVSAVPDPTAFDKAYFDDLYRVHAEDFLRGIQRNGLLIVDSEKRLERALRGQIDAVPIKYRQRLQTLLAELLKIRKKRVVECRVAPSSTLSVNLLDLADHLKTSTQADALIVGAASLKTLQSDQRDSKGIVPLSEYRDSDFETDRQRYANQVGPIDTLPKSEVDDLIIRSVRFSKWLRFYDGYVGTGNNTSHFRKGIEYILSLWHAHGFFASQPGIGTVEIFTCSDGRNLARNQANYREVIQDIIEPLKKEFPNWPLKLFVKEDPRRIFHARYLETQHAIIRVERGFDLFKQNGEFRRNFFTLNMAEGSHLKECRDLPDAAL